MELFRNKKRHLFFLKTLSIFFCKKSLKQRAGLRLSSFYKKIIYICLFPRKYNLSLNYMKIEAKDEEELKNYKDRAMMLKMLVLDEMGMSPIVNTSSFSKRQKIKLEVEIERKWNDTDILEKFNELCAQTIFEDGKMNIEEMTVGKTTNPSIPEEELKHLEEWHKSNEIK